jgi:hypothetical protein
VAVRVTSAAAVASSPGSPTIPVVGASVVTASTIMITMRDDLPVAAGAVATMGGSTGCCPSTVGVSR